jgi:hypothetical protein
MNKETKEILKEIVKKSEITRADASLLISELFTSPEECAAALIINAKWLREQISATKPFLKSTSEAIKAESIKRLSPKKTKVN